MILLCLICFEELSFCLKDIEISCGLFDLKNYSFYLCVCCMSMHVTHRGQKRGSDPLPGAGVTGDLSCLAWVPGTELLYSAKTASALNCPGTSLAPNS